MKQFKNPFRTLFLMDNPYLANIIIKGLSVFRAKMDKKASLRFDYLENRK